MNVSRAPRSYVLEPAASGRQDVRGDYRTLTGNVHNYFLPPEEAKPALQTS
jgi:hypothetical protein